MTVSYALIYKNLKIYEYTNANGETLVNTKKNATEFMNKLWTHIYESENEILILCKMFFSKLEMHVKNYWNHESHNFWQ